MENCVPFKPSRIASIDVLRAVTMLTMIFVNEFWSISGVPHWLEHAASGEDMLGFSDVVFPSFLFIMGMSIPLAIESQLQKGVSKLVVLENIIARTFALLVMGMFTVNYESGTDPNLWLSKPMYGIIMFVALILVWNLYPKVGSFSSKSIQRGFKIVGYIALAFLAYTYRGPEGELFSQRWWGILGLIGWAYVFIATIYLYNRLHIRRLIGIFFVFILLSIFGSNGWLGAFANVIPGDGGIQVFSMTGLLLTLLLKHRSINFGINKRLGIAAILGIVFLIAGWISHHFWIVSKMGSTPTWIFYCCGISILVYLFFYWLTDIKGKGSWFGIIATAGTATLTCYLIPYLLYSVISITGFVYPEFLLVSSIGLLKCLAVAFLVIGIAYLLGKVGIKLKI